jgi:YidC/Oxa1 family membrane protein insertase
MIFLGVQMYFDSQNQDELKKWNTQRIAKLEAKAEVVTQEIENKTAKLESLPYVKLYSDSAMNENIGSGILSGQGIVTLDVNLPETVYAFSDATKKVVPFKRRFSSEVAPLFSIFTSNDKGLISLGQLNYFGSYDLQLIEGDQVFLGEIVDGSFALQATNLLKIYRQMDESKKLPETIQVPDSNAIVLFQHAKGYLPVGIYNPQNKSFFNFETIENIDRYASLIPFKQSEKVENAKEKFYVLENEYQQLVFSSRGGALVEINLPLKDKNFPNSVILPVKNDKEMVSQYPYNARFPSRPYFTAAEKAGGELVEHTNGALGGYYPLIRRDLIESARKLSRNVPAQFYSTNLVSEFPEVAELNYKVKEFTKDKIVLEAQQSFRKITKTYTLDSSQAPYTFKLDIQVDGDTRSLWLSTGVPEVEIISSSPAPALKYRISRGKSAEVKQIDLPSEAVSYSQVQPDWICNSNGFFGIIMDPLSNMEGGFKVQKVNGDADVSRMVELGFKAEDLPGYMMLMPLKGSAGKYSFRFFTGPFATDLLKNIDAHYTDAATGYNPDYIASQSFHGWFEIISGPFAKFLFFLMNIFHTITGSWGFSIILLTIALRIMMYPLNAWSMNSSTKMQQVMPKVQAIQEKYKKDPKRAQAEIINLYRENKINPVSGCLPLLIQLPFLIGMFDLLKSAFELRGASFVPGWIDDLAAPDVLFSWNYSLPIIGNQFHLLPILTGLVMFFQQRWMAPAPTGEISDKDRQQKAMGTIMAVMFTFMFYNFPSGINIYWISTSILGMLQQWWTKRRLAALGEKPVVIQGTTNKR